MKEKKSEIFNDFNGIILVDKKSGKGTYDIIRSLKKNSFLRK